MRAARRSPIGLDVGERSICAVQLSGGKSGTWRMEAATILARSSATIWPSGEEMREVLGALDRQGFNGNRVVCVAPESLKISATLELPPRTSGAPIEELARQELARSAKRDPGSMEVGSWEVPAPPRSGDTTHLLAVGLAHQDAESLIEALETGGFFVEALECRCCAMARACAQVVGSVNQVSAIVDLNESATSIGVMHSGTVAYDRPVLETGLVRLREQLQLELRTELESTDYLLRALTSAGGITAEDGLPEGSLRRAIAIVEDYLSTVVQELRSVMAYAIHRYPGSIGPVLLVGPGAWLHGLRERVRTELDLETKVVSPRDVIACDGLPELDRVCMDPALTTAVGMAMRTGAAMRRAA
jgi:Tfp pilus assembly PilM family ATPase